MKMRIPFLLILSLVINLDAAPFRKAAAARANITSKKNLCMAGYFNDVMGYTSSIYALCTIATYVTFTVCRISHLVQKP